MLGRARMTPLWFAVGLACCVGTASAHDLKGLTIEAVNSASPALAEAIAKADPATKSVLSNLRLWPVPRKLTICFHGGSTDVRKRVTAAMQTLWPIGQLSDGRLDYDIASFIQPPDCSSPASSDIRVSFTPRDGYWSYVGVESLQHDPSMNLQGYASSLPSEQEFNEKVGHEMGHALGLEHEHQSPASDCKWDFDWIWDNYSWNSKEDMHFNLDKLKNFISNGQHAYTFSNYDPKSLMHYSFQQKAFSDDGQDVCMVNQVFVPSGQDLNAISLAYGSRAPGQLQTRAATSDLLKLVTGENASKLQALIDTKAKLLNQ